MQACRLLMAQAYIHLWEKAYDALLYHSINYRDLPEYQDQTLLDDARRVVVLQGRQKVLLWIERVEHGIEAAIRRKTFHRVT